MSADASPAVILDSHAHVVHSSVVGEDYELSVWLPPSYSSSTNRFPVVYALDGPVTFGLAAHGALLMIFGQAVPELIVVSIGQPLKSAYEWGNSRTRDYSLLPIPNEIGSLVSSMISCRRSMVHCSGLKNFSIPVRSR